MQTENMGRINALGELLRRSDSAAIEAADGVMSAAEYAAMRSQRHAWRKELRELEGNPMTVGELRAAKILESKAALADFLAANPLSSRAHGGAEALYSVTSEKQGLLNGAVVMAQGAAMAGIPHEITWNAAGEECEVWTLAELQQLAFEVYAYVKPFVAYQQAQEKALNGCKTVEEVEAVEIDYAAALASILAANGGAR